MFIQDAQWSKKKFAVYAAEKPGYVNIFVYKLGRESVRINTGKAGKEHCIKFVLGKPHKKNLLVVRLLRGGGG